MALKINKRWWIRSLGVLEDATYWLRLRSPEQLVLPTFLGIGAQRSGTTWLYENLRQHPEISLALPKELHFFDRRFGKGLKAYSRKFEASKSPVRGEITPAYSIIPRRTIRFIRYLMPALRIVLLLRNPVARSWSHAVKDLIAKSNKRLEGLDKSILYEFLHSPPCVARSSYRNIIANWAGVFPREQIFIGVFDDLVAQPEKLLREVLAHLGVASDIDLTNFPLRPTISAGQHLNANAKDPKLLMPPKIEQMLTAFYRDEIEALHAELGDKVQGWRR